jgi:cytochrome c556
MSHLCKAVVFLSVGFLLLALPGQATPQVKTGTTKVQPKLEPIAETKLLMEGLAYANFRGLERILNEKPADVQAWTFARGQALLIAEAGNLFMLRPPKDAKAQPVWFERSMELRTQATQLARAIASKDFDGSKRGLVNLANSCNRCHKTFRVTAEIVPFAPNPEDK